VSRARSGLLACLGALSLCSARDARAEVLWHGADCGASTPSRAAAPDDGEPRVDVDVVQHGAGWAATLTARYPSGASGTRHIEAASCAELERAVAVSLSLLEPADGARTAARRVPSVASRNTPAADEGAGERAAAAAGGDRGAPSARTSDVEGSPEDAGVVESAPWAQGARLGFVRSAALVGMGGGRFAELGAALSGGLWFGRWGGRLEVGARRPLSAIAAEHGVSLELTRVSAALEACGRSGTWIEWGLCAGTRLELVTGLASGPSDPTSDGVVLPGVGAGSFLRIPFAPRWALSSELQGSWALRGAEAHVLPWGRVYELPRLGASLLVGVEWAL
jgi:hypothetical protein